MDRKRQRSNRPKSSATVWVPSSPTTSCMWLLPYVVVFLAFWASGYLFHEYQKHNRRRW